MSNTPFSELQIAEAISTGAKETGDWLASYAASTEQLSGEAEAKAEQALAGYSGVEREKLVATAREEARRAVYASATQNENFAHKVKQLSGMRDQLAKRLEMVKDSVQVLERATVHMPERSTYEANIKGSGEAALGNLYTMAIETKNAALGAALIRQLQEVKAEKRERLGLHIRPLAEQCLPEHCLTTRKHLAAAREALDAGLLHFQRVQSPHRTSARSLSKIASGLDRMAADREAARKVDPFAALNKILRGES